MFLKIEKETWGRVFTKNSYLSKICLRYKYVATLIATKSEGSEKWLRFDSKLFDLNNNPSQAGQNIIWLDNIHG